MIVRSTRERYGGGFRLVHYEPDEQGRCRPKLAESDFDEMIDSFYVLREEQLRALEEKVMAGEVSPIALFMALTRATVEDVAARMGIRRSTVRAHMTPSGFEKARVETLKRYARIFDIAVADFFEFTHIDQDVSAEVARSPGRIVQKITVRHEP